MINLIHDNLFTTNCDIIAHGVNCSGGFGSGVAGIIRHSYPKARELYFQKYETSNWTLGDIQAVVNNDKIILNCATQQYYGKSKDDANIYLDYDALKTCLNKVKEFAKLGGLSIAAPKIGAGLAGGDWNKREQIFKDVFTDYDINIYYL